MMNDDYYNTCKVWKHLSGNPTVETINKWMRNNNDKVEVDNMGNILKFKEGKEA